MLSLALPPAFLEGSPGSSFLLRPASPLLPQQRIRELTTTEYTYGYLGSTKEISLRYCFCSVADPDPGWVKNQDSYPGSGIQIRDEQPRSYLREHRNHLLGLLLN
jgi:hypothetical protein